MFHSVYITFSFLLFLLLCCFPLDRAVVVVMLYRFQGQISLASRYLIIICCWHIFWCTQGPAHTGFDLVGPSIRWPSARLVSAILLYMKRRSSGPILSSWDMIDCFRSNSWSTDTLARNSFIKFPKYSGPTPHFDSILSLSFPFLVMSAVFSNIY